MPASRQSSTNFSIRDFLYYYLPYWPWYALSLMLAYSSAFLYLRYAEPIYNANAMLQIKSESNTSGAGEKFENMFFLKEQDNLVDEIEILKSRNMAGRVASAMHLEAQYFAIGNVKTTLIYPHSPLKIEVLKTVDSLQTIQFRLSPINEKEFYVEENRERKFEFDVPFQLGNSLIKVSRITDLPSTQVLQNEEYLIVWKPISKAMWTVKGGLEVTKVKDLSNLLQLSYNGIHPELGKDILNQLVVEYQQANIEDKNQIASRTNNFINERLGIITRELGDVEKDLQGFRQKNSLINIEEQSTDLLGEISNINKQITDIEVQLNVIGYLQNYLGDNNNVHEVVPTTLGINEPNLVQLVAEYNTIQLRRAAELKSTTAENPYIKAMDQQLEKIRTNLSENLRTLYRSTALTRDNLKASAARYKSTVSAIPMKEKAFIEIKRQQGIKEALYLFLLQKREETNISLASTISNSKLVDSAVASESPIKPDRKNIYTIALFLGFFLPTVLLYLRELLDDKIKSRKDIEKISSMPVLGEIGHASTSNVLQVKPNSKNFISEQFRMLRSNLQYVLNNITGTPVIMTTSTFSGEGKSFVSINLGAAMALSGKKTVILEFDLRKPKILHSLGMKRGEGLSNFLVGSARLESLPIPVTGIENLFVVACGAIPPNPGEMLGDDRMELVFRYLQREFDVVVMDTAPVGLVSDAQILSRFASATLYVVRSNYTHKKQVHFVEDLYQQEKLPKMALLVNDIDGKIGHYSYGNYHYGYGYGYGYGVDSGYFDLEKSKPWWKFWSRKA